MLYGFATILMLLVAGVAILLVAPPTDLIRDRVIAEVKAKTGRDLQVGSARLTLVPSIGVNLKDVVLSAPPGMEGPPLLAAAGIDVSVALLPLITREVKIDKLVLVKPVLDLRVDKTGRRSWDFAEAEPLRQPVPARFAQAPSAPRGQEFRKLPTELQDFAKNASPGNRPAERLASVSALSLGDVRISGGTLRYGDVRSGVAHEVGEIDARIALKDLGGPLNVNGQLVWAKETLKVDASVFSLRDLVEERPTRLTLKLDGRPVTVSYDGEVTSGVTPVVDGRVALKSPAVQDLARLLQVPVAGLEKIGILGIEGTIKTTPASLALGNGTYAFGDLNATGAIAVDMSRQRPMIRATLSIPVLDFDRLGEMNFALPQGARATATPPLPAADTAPSVAPAAPVPTAPAQSIEDLLKRTETPTKGGPVVRGFTKRSGDGWSQEPLSLAALNLFDLDGRFAIGQLTVQRVKLAHTQLGVQLTGGVLKANLQETQLYGGRGRGIVNLDARQQQAALSANISADGVAAGLLLKDAADADMVEGRGRVLIVVTATGGSERELVGTLAGKAEMQLADGAVLGWSVPDIMAEVSQLRIPTFDRKPNAKTPFTELAGTFQIANGVARNQDLRFTSAQLKATGSGVVNLVDRNLDMLVKPVATGAGGVGGFDMPLRIAGNFDQIRVQPQVQQSDKLKQIGRQVRDGDIDGAVKGVLGDGPAAQEKAAKAKELLRQFLGR